MLNINYSDSISYSFPRYYSCDVEWYVRSEMATKKYYIDNIKPNYNLIDAGAQIGMYTVLFSKLAHEGTVHAFEPTDTAILLDENVKFNNCHNVSIHNVALSNRDGIYNDTIYKIWSQKLTEKKEFPFTTIDTFVKKMQFKPDLIKIDVDSYDFEVLQGSKETLINHEPIIVVELDDCLQKRGSTPQEVIDFMKSIQYTVKQAFDGANFLFTKDKV